MFPQDVFDLIAMFSGEPNVIHTFKLTPQLLFYQKNISLVYGQVQSGKTAMIIKLLRKSVLPCVLIIQNSLLVLKQYMSRFNTNGIGFQTIHQPFIHSNVIIIMNNASQYKKFLALNFPKRFSLFMDESDLTKFNPLVPLATNQVHITATPFNYKQTFDKIIRISPPTNYFGIEKVIMLPKPDELKPIVDDFTSNEGGILLINQFSLIRDMNEAALQLSKQSHIPIIVLSTHKMSFLNGVSSPIRSTDIQLIIDSFTSKHIIIFANRLANRGLSFSSSDFKRHITHQVFGNFYSITSFLQKSRIFGVYNDSPVLKMFLPQALIPKAISFIDKIKLDNSLLKDKPHNLFYC
jgi:vacuolar-type H+-ATPase subunit F/Vma7